MKLNNTQIKALAQEVLNKIPETKKEFTKKQLTKYTKIVNEYKKISNEISVLEEKLATIKKDINNTGEFRYCYGSDLMDIKELEKELIIKNEKPHLDEIVHKITLETIFETKESMNDFIDNLVRQYSK